MYYLIEDSPSGLTVIGNYMTEEEAQRKAIELWNDYCNYIITRVWE